MLATDEVWPGDAVGRWADVDTDVAIDEGLATEQNTSMWHCDFDGPNFAGNFLNYHSFESSSKGGILQEKLLKHHSKSHKSIIPNNSIANTMTLVVTIYHHKLLGVCMRSGSISCL
ncbi:hypothetical protein ElyMa_006974300 [Elysia marginata]|uniref:Uncharacterized protein n=1 Tax=Elysia marginata TaxID=1093978 RepID=A0AAV4JLY1_9GAST|nr:hypothetical protein ElyMa_006974300 [Elysia marginata]